MMRFLFLHSIQSDYKHLRHFHSGTTYLVRAKVLRFSGKTLKTDTRPLIPMVLALPVGYSRSLLVRV